jgi:hypothetical protein
LRNARAWVAPCWPWRKSAQPPPRHRTLWLTAWTGNAGARAFYLAQGYADLGATSHAFEGQAYENRIYGKLLPRTS